MARKGVRRLVWWLVVLPALLLGGYAAGAWLLLDRTLASAGVRARTLRFELASPEGSAVDTSLPRVARVEGTRLDAQNGLPEAGGGLIDRRLAWSPSRFRWVDDPPQPLPPAELLKLKGLSALPPPKLIDILESQD